MPPESGAQQPSPPPADLRALHRVLGRVRRRLRLQAASVGAVQGAIAGVAVLLVGTVAHRLGRLSVAHLRLLLPVVGALVVLGALAQALRRIRPLDVAGLIDRSHALHDRLGSAIQFSGAPAPGDTGLLRELAVRDALQVAPQVDPGRAAPWQPPPLLPLLSVLCLCLGAAALLRLPGRQVAAPAQAAPGAAVARLYVDPELIAPERDEVARLLAEAERTGDEELKDLAREMQKLLDQVERGELTRKEAFDKLAELEQRLMEGKDGALEDLKEQLRKAGAELGKDKLAKELGRALEREDLDKARKELEKLAQSARDRQKLSERQGKDRQELAQSLRRSAQALRDQAEPKAEKNDPKDEWKDKTDAEKRTQQEQALREEERRLKKKLEENPKDEESARRLKKTQRELERLERDKGERAEAQRELERLRKDMDKAAEEFEKQLQQMTPEQRKSLEQLAKDLSRMQDEIRKLQQQSGQGQNGQNGKNGQGQGGQGGMGQARVALGSLKQVLRRVGKSGPPGQNGQGQGQGQQGQAKGGQGQGQGQGKDGKGKNPMKDFLDRAGGKGQGGDSDVLVEGDGQGKGDQQVMILGEGGNTPLILPGMGSQGQQPGGGQGQGQNHPKGQDGIGKDHDPNLLGDPTKLNAKLRNTRVNGKEGAGPTRSETILGSAERGFAAAPYRKVYQDYTSVAEEVMSRERVPPGYRFYVKRYFQLIKPRE